MKLQRKIWGLERYMMDDIAAGIDVVFTQGLFFSLVTAAHHPSEQVCATCISSVSRFLQLFDFPIVFFDEASMATEAASIIPLTKGVSIHLLCIFPDR